MQLSEVLFEMVKGRQLNYMCTNRFRWFIKLDGAPNSMRLRWVGYDLHLSLRVANWETRNFSFATIITSLKFRLDGGRRRALLVHKRKAFARFSIRCQKNFCFSRQNLITMRHFGKSAIWPTFQYLLPKFICCS